MQNYKKRPWR